MHYIAVTPDAILFCESILLGQNGHKLQFIAYDVGHVIRGYDQKTFASVVLDNTRANEKVWMIRKEQVSLMYFQGCCSHGLYLLARYM